MFARRFYESVNTKRMSTEAHEEARHFAGVMRRVMADRRITDHEAVEVEQGLIRLTAITAAVDITDQLSRAVGRARSPKQLQSLVDSYLAVADELPAA